MKNPSRLEKGQTLVLLVLGLIGLLAITALAIDGGNAFADRRNAQNAVDNAAYAAALAWVKVQDYVPAGDTIINGNGYTSSNSTWSYTTSSVTCTTGAPGMVITITLNTTVNTYFASIVGWDQFHNKVTAQARGCKTIRAPLFPGNAVVGLKPAGDSFYVNGNAGWVITGGGVFANSNAQGKQGSSKVEKFVLDPGQAVVAVGNAPDFPSTVPIQTGAPQVSYPASVQSMLPPQPPCDGTPTGGIVYDKLPAVDTTFLDGIYCIMNGVASSPTSASYYVNNATLYFVNPNFDLKFAGGGGFVGTAPTVGPYANYFIIVGMPANPSTTTCSGNFELRGNGSGDIVGTIAAPSMCIDYRGNPGFQTIGQVIGFEVTTLGTTDVNINYNAANTGQGSQPATVELLK